MPVQSSIKKWGLLFSTLLLSLTASATRVEKLWVDDNMIRFVPGAAPTPYEGTIYYDNTDKALSVYNDEADSSLQVGQESWIRVRNETGTTISNGQVVYITGESSGLPLVQLADASFATAAVTTIGVATHDIETATNGYVTTDGIVRNLNTSAYSAADVLYLDPTTPGALTTTRPSSPNYTFAIGTVLTVDGSDGTLQVKVENLENYVSNIKFYNGNVLEDHDFSVTSDGATVTASLQKSGGGDLTLFFNGTYVFFDTTPAATVTLTAGSDTSPTLNYVYIPESTNTLTASTTGFPTAQHVPVATVLVQSAASVQTYDAYKVHAWTDHLVDSNQQGHLSHINNWIRKQDATWISGTALTPTVGVLTYDVAVSAGTTLQLHMHDYPAFDTSTGSDVYVVNDSTTAYNRVGDLTGELTDADGDSMSGRIFSLVFWGSVAEDTAESKLYVNLPTGSYSNSANAIADSLNYSVYTIPSEFKGTGFLIARVVTSHSTAGGGTWTVELNEDLRGQFPQVGAGGSATGGSDFFDNAFQIFNFSDNTKIATFSAADITTGTTRTYTFQDADGDLLVDASGVVTVQGDQIIYNADGAGLATGSIFYGDGGTSLTASGVNNVGIGLLTLAAVTDGASNCAMGFASMPAVTTGGNNLAMGRQTLNSLITGSNNVAIGSQALLSTTASNNIAIGGTCGRDVTTGSANTFVGYNTARGIITGGNNTVIGANVTGLSSALTNYLILADGSGNIRMMGDSNGYIGIGNAQDPTAGLEVFGENGTEGKIQIRNASSSNSAGAANFGSVRSMGTLASPTAVTSGAWLLTLFSDGFYDASNVGNGARIRSLASENWASGQYGSYWVFETVDNGTSTIDERMRIDQNGEVGIGTTTPDRLLEVVGTSSTSTIRNTVYVDSISVAPSIDLRKSRGTESSPTTVAANDVLGYVSWGAYDGSAISNGPYISAVASETWSGTARGSDIAFYTIDDTTTTQDVRMTIKDDGKVGIGTTDPTYKLELAGTSGIVDNSAIATFIYSDDTAPARIILSKARGTQSSPSAVLSGDRLGSVGGGGYTGAGMSNANASIVFTATENWSVGNNGTSIIFDTVANGASVNSQRMIIDQDGEVGIGTGTPTAKLDVNGGIKPAAVTSDPCGSGYPEGTLFYNDTSNYMCYCDGTNDVQMHDPTTACF